MESADGELCQSVNALTIDTITGDLHVVNWEKAKTNWEHLRGIPFPLASRRPVVDVLLGLDMHELHSCYQDVRGHSGEPVARLTRLGCTCVGPPSLVGADRRVHCTFLVLTDGPLLWCPLYLCNYGSPLYMCNYECLPPCTCVTMDAPCTCVTMMPPVPV